MPKKGRARRDQYYHLAKESGYRSRAAFKLLQLDNKLGFMSTARCVVDLCAAPGGWLQAASERMPGGSMIIGVDLVPIRPLQGIITLQGDITTQECRSAILKQMTGWLADVVLHDGSPNIGGNWPREAFDQNCLVLSAVKLASSILKRGGSFVTKVFRSQDYTALLGVFRKLFSKVQATKPAASRSESAEIFVVCMNYQPVIGESRADLFDPHKVFAATSAPTVNIVPVVKSGEAAAAAVLRERKRLGKSREGYGDDAAGNLSYAALSAVKFIACNDGTHARLIAESGSIALDDPKIADHPLTTAEIKECCRDVRVLGRRDLRLLLAWRRKMGKLITRDEKKKNAADTPKEAEEEKEPVDEAEVEQRRIDEQIQALRKSEDHRQKKKLKKERESKLAARKRMTAAPEAAKFRSVHDLMLEEQGGHNELFSLNQLRSIADLQATMDADATELATDAEDQSDDEEEGVRRRRKTVAYERDEDREYADEDLLRDVPEDDAAADKKARRKLAKQEKKAKKAKKDEVEKMSDDDDASAEEDEVLGECPLEMSCEPTSERDQRLIEQWKSTVSSIVKGDSTTRSKKQTKRKKQADSSDDDSSDDSGDELAEWELEAMARIKGKGVLQEEVKEESAKPTPKKKEPEKKNKEKKRKIERDDGDSTDSDFDEVKPNVKHDIDAKLESDPVALAMGARMIKSRKSRREMIESGYNRYAFGSAEENSCLPSWFIESEKHHRQPSMPVTREEIQIYKERLRALDARPIHKVAEARGRKKRRVQGKIDAARKEAEKLAENDQLTDAERQAALKRLYRSARSSARKENRVQLVMARGRATTKRTVRPPGVKGRYKVVDTRMKKDLRAQKNAARGQKKASRSKKGGRRR